MTAHGHSVGRLVAVLVALLGVTAAVRAPRDRGPLPSRADQPAVTGPREEAPELAWQAITVMGLNPFRVDRKAPSLRYDPGSVRAPPPEPPPPPPPPIPRPEWTLTGILWGSEPVAVFEGVPGQEGAMIVAEGDTVGIMVIRSIAPDSVLVAHPDTVWTFSVGEPWDREEVGR